MSVKKISIAVLTLSASFAINCKAAKNPLCSQAPKAMQASRFRAKDERIPAFERRFGSAASRTLCQKKHSVTREGTGDEKPLAHFAAQFTKTLEHDPATGLLTPAGEQSYKQLLKALCSGKQSDFNAIKRATGASKLVNPQGSCMFSLEGLDSGSSCIPRFPRISTPEAAAELIELYLMALCRDVHFSDYGTGLQTDATTLGTGSLTNNAASVLQDLGSAYSGPRVNGVVNASVLFRNNSYGSLIGPYTSQFLLKPVPTVFTPGLGTETLAQGVFVQMHQLRPIASTREFGVSFADFVAIQNGTVPQKYIASDYNAIDKRFAIDGRDMASYVHWDTIYEPYYNAVTILLGARAPLAPTCPYATTTITNEVAKVSMGDFDLYGMVGAVAEESVKAAWAQKWRAYRTLRPDAFGGLVQNVKSTGSNPYHLDESLFAPHAGIDVLALIQAKNTQQGAATYLLSQVYPEGSPGHPSYPSGHAAIAGACVTVIKAVFNDTIKIKALFTPVKPNPLNPTQLIPLVNEGEDQMTLGSELDKFASNISNGRNFAGIHYRADAEQGCLLGEQIAIAFLQDQAAMYTEEGFTGFELTKIDGTRIRITAESVKNI